MFSRALIALAIVGLCSSTALAQDDPASDNPRWLRRPSAALIAKVYPEKALRRGIGGRVVLDCIVDGDGRMKDCQVSSETPADYNFGQGALKVSHAFLLTKATPSGKSTEGSRMRIPLSFTPPPID